MTNLDPRVQRAAAEHLELQNERLRLGKKLLPVVIIAMLAFLVIGIIAAVKLGS